MDALKTPDVYLQDHLREFGRERALSNMNRRKALRSFQRSRASRGEIYFVSLDPTRGREQRGKRPVLIVSSDALNRQPLVTTVVPGTSSERVPRDYPTNVRAAAAETGLAHDTVFLCFQLRSLDPSRFSGPPAGRMPQIRMRQVEEALRLVLDL